MSDTILQCPACGTSLRAPATLGANTAIRCKKCQVIFPVPKTLAARPAAPAPRPEPPPRPASPQRTGYVSRPADVRPAPREEAPAPRPRRLARKAPPGIRVSLPMIVAVGAGAVLLCLGLIILLGVRSRDDDPGPDDGRTVASRNDDRRDQRPIVAPPAGIPQPPPRPEPPVENRDIHQTLAAVKAATVFIKVGAGEESGSGSGFLMLAQGQVGYIVTNCHVVVPPAKPDQPRRPGRRPRPAVTAVFDSGTPRERAFPADVLALDPERDLAVLRVERVPDLPRPLDPAGAPRVYETLPVLICGFPFGEALATGGRHPAISVGRGAVSSLRLDGGGQTEVVQIDGALNPGNSGGPVVDERGRLVGIAVATIKGGGVGFAIPPHHLAQLLAGRALDPALVAVRGERGGIEFVAVVPLADPFGRIRSVSLRHATADSASGLPGPGPGGEWAPLPGSRLVEAEIVEGKMALVRLPLRPTPGTEDLLQVAYVNGEGRTIIAQPIAFALDGAAVADRPPDPAGGVRIDGLSLEMVNRFPERFVGAPITVRACLAGPVVGRGDITELQIVTEGNARPSNLTFQVSRDLATQITDEAWGAGSRVQLTGKIESVNRNPRGRTVFHVSRVNLLDGSRRVVKSLPTELRNLPAAPSLAILNRAADRYVGKTLPVEARLYKSVVGRGEVRELQVSNAKGAKPMNLYFTTTIPIADRLTRFWPSAEQEAAVRLTGTVLDKRWGRQTYFHVTRIDFLGPDGRVTATVR